MQCLYGPKSDDNSSRSVLRSDVLKETCCLRASISSGLPRSSPSFSVLRFPVLRCSVLFCSHLHPFAACLLYIVAATTTPNDMGAEPSFYHPVPTTGTCLSPRAQTLARGPSGTWSCVNRKLRHAICCVGCWEHPGRPSFFHWLQLGCGSSRTQPAWLLHCAMQSTWVRP